MIQFNSLIMKKIFGASVLFLLIINSTVTYSQKKNINTTSSQVSSKPKIIIGLVIDQMRWDYLYKFSDVYGNNGFKRLLNQGFSCDNTLITHLPTYTAVGHTGIYTGAYPSSHGIVGNNWYDRLSGKMVYCTDDNNVSGVGSNNDEGKMSPSNMFVNSITDELKLSNNFQSKVIGISLKDRGAILPAGHSANAAYWFDDKEGKWISSTYYMNDLPLWVNAFNDKKQPDAFMSSDWNTMLPLNNYTLSSTDSAVYEGNIPGDNTTTFPHQLSRIKEKKYNALKYTPFGNTFTLNFAKAAIENENLGKNKVPDFLTISLSSTDYVGHTFGPNSVEIEDTYIRLDKDIADLLNYLDASFGKNNYLLFLSADHGVANVPAYLNDNKIPGGVINNKELLKELNSYLQSKTNLANSIVKIENSQLYLNDSIPENNTIRSVISSDIISVLNKKSYVSQAFSLKEINNYTLPDQIRYMTMNSFNPQRSGDIQIIPKPNYFDGNKTGTTHGLWNPYDAHIPLVWYGWNIHTGNTHRETHMTDIAATLAALLNIQMPNGCVGKVINEVVK